METWRTIIRWSHVETGETGVFEDTSEFPHSVLIEMMRGDVRVKLNGCTARGRPPLVDFVAKTLEYDVELFPL